MTSNAKELLEVGLLEGLLSQSIVTVIAILLFVDVDVEHAAWNFFYNTKYH